MSAVRWDLIGIFFGVCIAICVLIWCCRGFCEGKIIAREELSTGSDRQDTLTLPRSPARDHSADRNLSILPLISPHPPKPPPLGFGHPVDAPQAGLSRTVTSNGYIDAHPLMRTAPYASDPEISAAPYRRDTAPYPLSNTMPQPSTSPCPYPSERHVRETSNSARTVPDSTAVRAPYPLSNASSAPLPSFSVTPYLIERNTGETCSGTTSFPPTSNISQSGEQPPPSYAEAVRDKL